MVRESGQYDINSILLVQSFCATEWRVKFCKSSIVLGKETSNCWMWGSIHAHEFRLVCCFVYIFSLISFLLVLSFARSYIL